MSNEKSRIPGTPFRLEITGGFLLLLSFTGFFCGYATLLAAGIAVTVHELGHLTALLLQDCIPASIRLDASGACICCVPAENRWAEVLRALSGPAAGLLLCLLPAGEPMLELTRRASLMLSLINLLPVSIMDGGRVLYALAGSGRPKLRKWVDFGLGLAVMAAGYLGAGSLGWYGLWVTIRSITVPQPD